ncbi:MAG: cobalamin-independent methionine synthase II family protein [Stellaceae bacterium]
MIRSTDRIKTTHAGTLPKARDLARMVASKAVHATVWRPQEPIVVDEAVFERRLKEEVAEVVKHEAEIGLDSVNDGELGKITFQHYCFERISGFEDRDWKPGMPVPLSIAMRDARKFPGYFSEGHAGFANADAPKTVSLCTGPLTYIGHDALKRDIDNFKAALQGIAVEDAFLPANTPGTLEHALRNVHYKTDEEYLEAIANVLRVEYKAITDAGLTLQLDDPDLPDGWEIWPEMTVSDYRNYAGLRIEALKHALAGIPREQVRLHVCWGSFHGPHEADIPLKDIADLIFSVPAQSYSIEASNPAHEHEWQVFETIKPPKDTVLIPGVVGHATDFIEHPDLVAQRLVRYAKLVGRENVAGGTDCGIGTRVKHPSIAWAKLDALVEGARRATKQLW